MACKSQIQPSKKRKRKNYNIQNLKYIKNSSKYFPKNRKHKMEQKKNVLDMKMPQKCCVPGCLSNFNNELKTGTSKYVSNFKFPTDEKLKQLWIRAISRPNWTPAKSSVVCIKHFEETDICLIDISKDKFGNIQRFPKNRPSLRRNVLPKLFLDLPDCTSKRKNSKKNKKGPKKLKQQKLKKIKEVVEYEDSIKSFDEFLIKLDKLSNKINEMWNIDVHNDYVFFYILQNESASNEISVRVTVDDGLYLNGFVNNLKRFKPLPVDLKVMRLLDVENVLNHYLVPPQIVVNPLPELVKAPEQLESNVIIKSEDTSGDVIEYEVTIENEIKKEPCEDLLQLQESIEIKSEIMDY